MTHTKESGVGIIINKNTLEKHIYSHLEIPGQLLQIRLRKITITITGVYGPADKSDKKTKNTIELPPLLSHFINVFENYDSHINGKNILG